MFLIEPPGPPGGGARAATLSVTRVLRRAFAPPARSGAGADAELYRFLADLVAPYGQAPDPVQQSYAAMAEALLRPAGLLDTPVDLIVLAHAVPDADPRQSVAHLLNRLCPGDPLAFALCDQGVAVPFSALATACEYLRAGGVGRALVLVLEQAVLPYQAVAPVSLPAAGSAVALLLEHSGAAPLLSVDQRAGVAGERVGAVFAELAGARPAGWPVVLGHELARRVDPTGPLGAGGPPVRVAPAGRLCTGVWWELADALAQPPAGQGVLVGEYDPALGCLGLLAVGPPVSGRPAATPW